MLSLSLFSRRWFASEIRGSFTVLDLGADRDSKPPKEWETKRTFGPQYKMDPRRHRCVNINTTRHLFKPPIAL